MTSFTMKGLHSATVNDVAIFSEFRTPAGRAAHFA
jgi:hypothetical protein